MPLFGSWQYKESLAIFGTPHCCFSAGTLAIHESTAVSTSNCSYWPPSPAVAQRDFLHSARAASCFSHQKAFLTKSLSFHLPKHLGSQRLEFKTCLLREAEEQLTDLPSLLASRKRAFLPLLQTKKDRHTHSPPVLLSVCLSIHFSDSL